MADESVYLDALLLIERLHRQFLDVLKGELDRIGYADINNVQSLILYNISDETLTVGELTNRGYYQGSNVSYNLKKLVENGYLEQERSRHDKRSTRVKLSEKGWELRNQITALFGRHMDLLFGEEAMDAGDVARANGVLRGLERFWHDQFRYGG